ncbi:hypothetical protein A3K63_02400 [Candidatus Micrarchaeota archaeon RBG_16_49_10]|nr:MAG: hypothetical protein A3K63_02400 [Candidatus Micrarchaeota archaeon RBG_16_49_10]
MLYGLEERLADEMGLTGLPKEPIFCIGGLVGTGKNIYAEGLKGYLSEVYRLELEVSTSGEIFRKLAREKGFGSISEYIASIEGPEVDISADSRALENALRDGGIYVGRITPGTIGGWGYTIGLKTDPAVVAKRLKADPKRDEHNMGLDEIEAGVRKRDADDLERYMRVYGVDFLSLMAGFDLMIDTTHLSEENVQETIDRLSGEWLERNYGYSPTLR